MIARLVEAQGVEVEIVRIKTTGDRLSEEKRPIEGKGIFTKELDEALIDRRIDFAVHSLKDLPSELASGLCLASVPDREDPRDVLISRARACLDELPAGATVGTGSPRRRGQLLARRPDLRCQEAQGNVDTRIRKLREGAWDAIVLARAGLRRLGRDSESSQVFDISEMIPAVGQGALAIVARDGEHYEPLAKLENGATRAAVLCERTILRELEGGCRAPLAAHAWLEDGILRVKAAVFSTDGTEFLAENESGPVGGPETLGRSVARRLLSRGAAAIISSARSALPAG
jgi:hydroxymethylbilane synthase